MSTRRSRKHSRRNFFAQRLAGPFAGLAGRPLRAGLVGALSLAALWLVLAKSLPYALAPKNPDAALALNSNNPAALVAKAEAVKRKLVAIIGAGAEAAKADQGEAAPKGNANTVSRLPEVRGASVEPAGERERLRGEIRDLATQAILRDPLNAQAFRLLAEATNGPDRVRYLMQASLRRSRREAVAAFWLLNDSFYRKDLASAVRYSDILLRTQPALQTYVLGYLLMIAENEEARRMVVEKLEAGPGWRPIFFETLPMSAKTADTPAKIVAALRNSKQPATEKELRPYLYSLISNKRVDLAYNVWLQSLSPSQTENMGLLTNPKFQNKPSGLPFDWAIGGGLNARAEIVPSEAGSKSNVLHVRLGDGRVKFPQVEQILLLPRGRYRLEGKLQGKVSGTRGLRWRLHCLYGVNGGQRIVGETEMLFGQTDEWRVFSFEAEIPQTSDCAGQVLRLVHNSRSKLGRTRLGRGLV